uniref:Uncharacterized protein n=1 Tax=Megaselia scalaris TaxID=36166 RepID=T1GX41_MEGSC
HGKRLILESNCFYNLLNNLKRRPEYLIPWLLVQFVVLVVLLIGIVYVFVLFVQFDPSKHSNDRPDLLYIILALTFVTSSYMWAVI